MGLSLSVALVFGVKVRRHHIPKARSLNAHPRVESWAINDASDCVVFVRGTHKSLASGTNGAPSCPVFDIERHIAQSVRDEDEQRRRVVCEALESIGLTGYADARWLVVSDVG